REVRPEYERNSPRMSSNSYVNLKIATCLVRYADDRLIDQRFLRALRRPGARHAVAACRMPARRPAAPPRRDSHGDARGADGPRSCRPAVDFGRRSADFFTPIRSPRPRIAPAAP
ncbi:hypothetical protein QZM92_27785, partial [Burkholderia multivorans]|nr:hypothetical protein [Burkholderia multivorans]